MRRRTVVRSGLALALGTGLAGCSGSTAPPPRQSKTFADVSVDGTTLQVALADTPTVETRATDAEAAVGALAPVGAARAAKGGAKGAAGRGSGGFRSAPKGRHGWAIYHGDDDYDEWREEHRDEVTRSEADILTVGVAYLGSDAAYSNDPPGPGPVPWDQTWSEPADGEQITVDLSQLAGGRVEGWYRVGTELRAADGQLKAPWEGADFEIDTGVGSDATIDKAWHVRPRL